jgi:hypothetical protein
MHRHLTLFLLALMMVLIPEGSHAQAKPAGIGPGAYTTIGIAGSVYESDYGKLHLVAPTIYVDTHLHRYVGLEAEARFLRHVPQASNYVSMNEFLVGPRYSFKPVNWVPYVKMPVGVAHMRFPYGLATGTYFVMAPGGGLEYWMQNDRVRVRVVDFEYQLWPQFTFGTLHPYGVSAGVSFHIF